jgi:methanogenic corrinoid protein MtbC1
MKVEIELLSWCAYCQQFQGEVAPFENLDITHGVCKPCTAKGIQGLEANIEHSLRLKEIQDELMAAGRMGDLEAAVKIIDSAVVSGLRPVDILVGLLAPLLYIIGEESDQGCISGAAARHFISFCEGVFTRIKDKFPGLDLSKTPNRRIKLLLMNGYQDRGHHDGAHKAGHGNDHTIGIQVLALWLESKNFDVRLVGHSPAHDELIKLLDSFRPSAILISLAMAEQRDGVVKMLDDLKASNRIVPDVWVGGHAIKMKMVDPIPGATFVTDISEIVDLLQQSVVVPPHTRR